MNMSRCRLWPPRSSPSTGNAPALANAGTGQISTVGFSPSSGVPSGSPGAFPRESGFKSAALREGYPRAIPALPEVREQPSGTASGRRRR